ncbi:hypothetical protein CHISP_1283 [Chitinispirillum alkaliphilum]|nr:hypothetical protein CHISP_1283 [Chitinispirillum alkaliphilum]
MTVKTVFTKLSKSYPAIILIIGLFAGISILSPTITNPEHDAVSLFDFSILHFLGYLFFIISFIEILFVHMMRTEAHPVILVMLSVVTAAAALCVDYWIGYSASKPVLLRIIGEKKYSKLRFKLERYRDPVLFTFNLLPLSSPLLTAVAGILRYDFKRVILISSLGLFIKYSVIAAALAFFIF